MLSAVRALLRRSRVEREVTALLFVLVAVSSLLAAAAPRLIDGVADEGLRYEVARASATQRDLQFVTIDQIPAQRGDPFALVEARGDDIWSRVPTSVRAIVGERGFQVELPRMALADPPVHATNVTFLAHSGVEELVEYLAGRPPVATAPAPVDGPWRFEIALSSATAATIGVEVGDRLAANVDPGDPILRTVFPRPTTAVEIEVVGTFRVLDPDAPAWLGETALQDAAVAGTDDAPLFDATALFAPDAYLDLRAMGLPASYRWQFTVDPVRLDAGRLDALVPDLQRVATVFGPSAGRSGALVYRTGLLPLIDGYAARRATTEATVSVAAFGPLGVAAGALAVVAVIIVGRRRAALLLARSRGASSGQLLVAQAIEGLLICLPAALAGLVLAVVAVPSRPNPASPVGAVAVAVAATALLVLASWQVARRARRDLERADVVARRPSPRRLVAEVTVVASAGASAWLLRERTVTERAVGGEAAAFDPFLAIAPVLVGVAVAIVVLRVFPLPLRVLAAVAAWRRDFVLVHGLRSLARRPSAAAVPLLVLTLTMAVGVFSSVVASTIELGQARSAWQEVGADHRIEAPPGSALGAEVDPASVDGVSAVAVGASLMAAPAPGTQASVTGILVHALDLTTYAAMLADTPVAVPLPLDVVEPPALPSSGSAERPIPVVMSTQRPNGWPDHGIGETFALTVQGRPIHLVVAGRAGSFPGIRREVPFVIVSYPALAAATPDRPIRPTVMFVADAPDAPGPEAAGPGVAGALEEMLTGSTLVETVTHRAARFAAAHDAPLVAAVAQGFAVALGIAVAYAALAVIALGVLEARRRARELAFLRTLGLEDRQLVGLTVIEHAPPVVLATVLGTATGAALAWLLEPGLGLAAFIPGGGPIDLQVDLPAVGAVLALILVVVAVSIGLAARLAHGTDAAAALRIGDA